MSRKVHRVPVSLDTKGITALTDQEIATLLRGADELIMRGGRNLLAKVLKGSREKRLLELKLDQSPVFGALGALSIEEILARIDWLIINDYLAIEYDYRLPLLVYTRQGWEIEKVTYTAEQHRRLDQLLATGEAAPDLAWLVEKNREVLLLLLDRIESTRSPKYIPLLEIWALLATKKIRAKIRTIIASLLEEPTFH